MGIKKRSEKADLSKIEPETKKKVKKQLQQEETPVEDSNDGNASVKAKSNIKKYIKNKATIKKLKERGIVSLFPIQEATYQFIYDGKDLIGRERTGCGKTLSYGLPITEKLRDEGYTSASSKKSRKNPIVMVLLPTRELCIQVFKEFENLNHTENEFRLTAVYGGAEIRDQIQSLRNGTDIVVCTPGRLIDLLNRGSIKLEDLKVVVLDEADQMLNVGFQEDIEKIYEYITNQKQQNEGQKVQMLLLSATVPKWVLDICKKYIDPSREYVDLIKNSENRTAKNVLHLAINCPYHQRIGSIGDVVLVYGGLHSRTIIFTETKKEANEIMLKAKLKTECQVLHGDIPQKQREITFQGFRDGNFKCLIATNVAARGLDIPEVDLIVQLDPPKEVESYIHRAGRTARAGRTGACIVFYSNKQLGLVERIEKKANIKFKRVGAPQPQDVIKASVRDITQGLKKVSNQMLNLFEEEAQNLIDELGPNEALQRALCYISGYHEEIQQRSLLCSIEGFVTYLAKSQQQFKSLGYIWSFLRNNFDYDVTQSIKGMKSFKDQQGAAFDVPEQHSHLFDQFIEQNQDSDKNILLSKATEIPDLVDEYASSNSNGSGSVTASSFVNQRHNYTTAQKKELEVCIANMSYEVTERDIDRLFRDKGVEFLEIRLLKDQQTQKSRGIAFALCKDKQALTNALRLNDYNFQRRKLRVNLAADRSRK